MILISLLRNIEKFLFSIIFILKNTNFLKKIRLYNNHCQQQYPFFKFITKTYLLIVLIYS